MPKLIPNERKERIVKRYKQLLNEFNSFIKSEDNKLVENELFEGSLDVPSTVDSYNIATEMEDMKVKQNKILDDLSKNNPLHISDDRKWLVCALKSEDTPYAKAYNEKLYNDYLENSDKVKAMLFRKVMTFDPSKLAACNDKETELIKFYKENHEVIDLADVLANSNGAPFYEGLDPAFVRALDQMSEPLNVIAYPKHLAEQALTDDFYAMPYMYDKDAKEIVINADEANKDFKGYVRDKLESLAGNDITLKPKAYFRAIKDINPALYIDSKFLSSYVSIQTDLNNAPDYCDYSDVIADPKNNSIFKRQEIESFNIRAVNKEYSKVYQNNWLKVFNKKNKMPEEANIKETLNKHKGGFFEKMFNTTSKEYREYEKALEDYHNPNSIYYLNDKNLRLKSNAYLEHKGVNALTDLSKLDETSRNRVQLVNNTLENLQQSDYLEKDAEKDLMRGYPVLGKSFLSEKDVSDSHEYENDNNINSPEKVNENVIDSDIKMQEVER